MNINKFMYLLYYKHTRYDQSYQTIMVKIHICTTNILSNKKNDIFKKNCNFNYNILGTNNRLLNT